MHFRVTNYSILEKLTAYLATTLLTVVGTGFYCTVSSEEMEQDLQAWNGVSVSIPLGHHFTGNLSGQHRWNQNLSQIDRTLGEASASLSITPSLSIAQGYTWRGTYQPSFAQEHRPWQYIQLQKKFKRLTIIERLRVEERYFKKTGDLIIRNRLFSQLGYQLDKKDNWRFLLSDEVFWTLNDSSSAAKAGFEQNRVFAGINRRLNKQVSVEGGYLLQYLAPNGVPSQKLNHAMVLTLKLAL